MAFDYGQALDVKTQDMLNAATGLIDSLYTDAAYDRAEVAALKQVLAWQLGDHLRDAEHGLAFHLAGMLLMLDVLRSHPEALQATVDALYAQVAEIAPRIHVAQASTRGDGSDEQA